MIPHVLARPSQRPKYESTDPRNEWEIDEDDVLERIGERYRQSRRKPPPNIYQSVKSIIQLKIVYFIKHFSF